MPSGSALIAYKSFTFIFLVPQTSRLSQNGDGRHYLRFASLEPGSCFACHCVAMYCNVMRRLLKS